jgi:hypothetical protein
MTNEEKAGYEILASLLEANIKTNRALFEQGLKIQAMELTLRSFPDAKPMYEKSLAEARTPEVVREFETGERLARASAHSVRVGQFPSD